MTTIAFDGKTLVTDSQQTCGYFISGSVNKIQTGKDFYYAATGYAEDMQAVYNWLVDLEPKPTVAEGFACFVIYGDKFVEMNTKLVPFEATVPCFLGSGSEIAAGAYAACGDIKRAVEIACQLDSKSGLPLQCITIGESKE